MFTLISLLSVGLDTGMWGGSSEGPTNGASTGTCYYSAGWYFIIQIQYTIFSYSNQCRIGVGSCRNLYRNSIMLR